MKLTRNCESSNSSIRYKGQSLVADPADLVQIPGGTCIFFAIIACAIMQFRKTMFDLGRTSEVYFNGRAFVKAFVKKYGPLQDDLRPRAKRALTLFKDDGVQAYDLSGEPPYFSRSMKIKSFTSYKPVPNPSKPGQVLALTFLQIVAILKEGNPVLGSFPILVDKDGKALPEYSMLGDGIYDCLAMKRRYPDKKADTHAVAFVDYGQCEGRPFLKCINTHGLWWGKDGFGKIYFDGINQIDDNFCFHTISFKDTAPSSLPTASTATDNRSELPPPCTVHLPCCWYKPLTTVLRTSGQVNAIDQSVGSNLIRADLNFSQSMLASSIWQYLADAPFLQAGDGSVADFDRNRELSNFGMLDSRKNKIVQGSVDVELFLEAALGLYCGKVNKPDRLKDLLLFARSIEADPSAVILWVFYLHIYYQEDEGLGKDDMFFHAVQHNGNSYELRLMYINSRLHDDRLDAYNDDALSMLCQMTVDTELKDRSAFILDIFSQMIYFLCMSENVEKAISRINGFLPTASPDCPGDRLLADAISCLAVSDRFISWISCLSLSVYRKLLEDMCDQLEFPKDLPGVLVWPPVELREDNTHKVAELLKYAYLTLAQFLAFSHISCLAAIEGFQSSVDMLVKYMKEFPRCPNILLISVRLYRKYDQCPDLKGFDELLMDWPKEVQEVQYLQNQYAEHALVVNIELGEKVLTCWFEEYGKDGDNHSIEACNEVSEEPSLAYTLEVCSGPFASEDQVYWLLNITLYTMLESNLQEVEVAVDKALKLAQGDRHGHCLREHATVHTLDRSSSCTNTQTRATLSLISGYIADHRNLPMRELLSRRFIQNVKKHKLTPLIDDAIGPACADSSVVNSVLEVCCGPCLLPEQIEVKYLVDFVESVMEILQTTA